MDLTTVNLTNVKRHAKLELGKLAGVEGFGIGDGTLRIYVRSSQDAEQLPAYFEGAPVEPVVSGEVVAAPAPGTPVAR